MTTNTSNNKVIRGLTSMMMMMMKMMIHLQKKGFWSFFHLFFFLDNIRQENVFYDILERKNAFLCYKNKKFKKSKN